MRITTIANRVTKDDDYDARNRLRQIAEREAELQQYARAGYALAHTAVIETTSDVTFVDTLTKDDED
jgi:hypothetical protein